MKMGTTQMLWSYNALYHIRRRHTIFFSFLSPPVSVIKCIVPLCSLIHQDPTRQHPGPVHLPHNIVLSRFIVRLVFFLQITFGLPKYQFSTPVHPQYLLATPSRNVRHSAP